VIKWKGYEQTTWENEENLEGSGELLKEFHNTIADQTAKRNSTSRKSIKKEKGKEKEKYQAIVVDQGFTISPKPPVKKHKSDYSEPPAVLDQNAVIFVNCRMNSHLNIC
jgi:hypothetical protein